MIRRSPASVAVLAVLASIAACAPAPATGESTPAASAPSLVAPSPRDGGAAQALRDRYAANGTLIGLAEDPAYRDEKLDSDGMACGRLLPLLDRRLAAVAHVFGTPDGTTPEEFVEITQETVVYPTEAVAAEAVRQIFDLFETCDQDVEAGQVTDGHAAADLPAGTGVPGRAVTATMTLPDGTRFPTVTAACATPGSCSASPSGPAPQETPRRGSRRRSSPPDKGCAGEGVPAGRRVPMLAGLVPVSGSTGPRCRRRCRRGDRRAAAGALPDRAVGTGDVVVDAGP
ncbi:hypothetical protein RMN56_27535 [Micromonospora halotolerans]|uniref:Lipoprotein n=1 Tax=Micromonospora halotolerans TaxID=709879 RepID=A0ABY9ZV09_9ACTN|nr:hypothetical protein [Micromonospora halotolerans]WNM38845.1 hypothetical protein RMN56_27535 [Micromonospora halotolerans]